MRLETRFRLSRREARYRRKWGRLMAIDPEVVAASIEARFEERNIAVSAGGGFAFRRDEIIVTVPAAPRATHCPLSTANRSMIRRTTAGNSIITSSRSPTRSQRFSRFVTRKLEHRSIMSCSANRCTSEILCISEIPFISGIRCISATPSIWETPLQGTVPDLLPSPRCGRTRPVVPARRPTCWFSILAWPPCPPRRVGSRPTRGFEIVPSCIPIGPTRTHCPQGQSTFHAPTKTRKESTETGTSTGRPDMAPSSPGSFGAIAPDAKILTQGVISSFGDGDDWDISAGHLRGSSPGAANSAFRSTSSTCRWAATRTTTFPRLHPKGFLF